MTMLTAHFSFEELIASDYAYRHNIDNQPYADLFPNLSMLAEGLERVRTILALPIHVSSGYRSPKLNATVGGAKSSKHMEGLAADFICPAYGTPKEVCKELAENYAVVGFDQLIMEGNWTHISFSDTPKGEVLTAHFGNGATTYTKGLS